MPHDPGEGFGQAVDSRYKASVCCGHTELCPQTWATKMQQGPQVPHVSSCLIQLIFKATETAGGMVLVDIDLPVTVVG